MIPQGLETIGQSEWSKCIAHVRSVEEMYWAIDIAVDVQEKLVIELVSDSDDDSGTDTASEGEDY